MFFLNTSKKISLQLRDVQTFTKKKVKAIECKLSRVY